MARRLLRAGGLRSRLTVWVAAVLIVSIAVVFGVVYQYTGSQLRGQIDGDVRGDAVQLSHSLAIGSGATPPAILAAARRYANAQPYGDTSPLLFAIIPGTGTASNHPELFGGGRPDDGETVAEQAAENALGRRLLVPRIGLTTRQIPDAGKVRVYELRSTIAGVDVVVGAGESLAIVARAQRGVIRSSILAGAITLLLALIASYIAGARVSAPLRRLAGVAARVDAGELEPRMPIDATSTSEVRVLADAFNHMLDRLGAAFAAQREFVADASHELRTPLTVIRGQLELLAVTESPTREEIQRVDRQVSAEIARISRLVDDMLLLAQAERTDFLRLESIDLVPFVSELWDGLSLTEERCFELDEVPAGTLMADPDRLAQALRNLARNAIEHTSGGDGLVRLEVEPIGVDRVLFAVLDDGPGIPAAERERVFERFHRTDPARSRASGGAGLGLAIVHAIVEAHHGVARAGRAETGGARIEFELPGLTLCRRRGREEPRPPGARLRDRRPA
jgi:two-component system OmpR family sensor kinase